MKKSKLEAVIFESFLAGLSSFWKINVRKSISIIMPVIYSWLIFGSFSLSAQIPVYQRDTSIKVYANGQEQTLAWCGGFNNPQFTMGDLNNDGLLDLVVFEPWNSVRTFINKGVPGHPHYIYAPDYALNFPPITNYMILADYNCDGIPDLFQQGQFGFWVYKGYYNIANQLCFTFYKDLSYAAGYGPFNNPGNIPAIVDVDHDGDLDILTYDFVGRNLLLYKNKSVEMGLPCDSIVLELDDYCWGRFSGSDYPGLELHCDFDTLIHCGNTACVFDYDMDGDYDYITGSTSDNMMPLLINGRIPYGPSGADSMVSQDSFWQSGGRQINLPTWPAAFSVDIDQDGLKDLLVAPNTQGTLSENYKCIWYYKNMSTPGVPNWQFQSDTFLIDKTIDLGSNAYPMLFDYNKDGKPDLLIGSDGYYQDNTGRLRSRISYYLNTSTPGNPSFTLQTRDFLGIDSFNFSGATLATGDIDNDGKTDLVIGHADGTISYFKNIAATDTVQPVWQLEQMALTDVNGDTINGTSFGHEYAAPFIYDIDKDGKKDLLIGNILGYLQYYQNVSTTPGTLRLKLVNAQLGNARVEPAWTFGNYSVPFIGKIDTSCIDYLLMGSNSGLIYRFTGFQSGDTTAIYTLLDSDYSYIDTNYNVIMHPGGGLVGIYGADNYGLRSAVTVGDIAGDGSLYMLVGNNKGGVESYKLGAKDLTKIKAVPDPNKISLFPNPASDELTITGVTHSSTLTTLRHSVPTMQTC